MSSTELREQARLVRWSHKPLVRELMPQLRYLHHSPNGGRRDSFTGAQMKALGTKPGFPDLVLPVKSPGSLGRTPGLAIEMKADKGKTTPEQDDWLAHLSAQGWYATVCRSADDAREVLCHYLAVDPAGAPPLDD
jgi:hypothetical protein